MPRPDLRPSQERLHSFAQRYDKELQVPGTVCIRWCQSEGQERALSQPEVVLEEVGRHVAALRATLEADGQRSGVR